ncbi:2284_t:CDS:2, partial [Dentiscutata heterogama]
WIDIPKKSNPNQKPQLPPDIEQLTTQLTKLDAELLKSIPIQHHTKAAETINKLRTYYSIKTIPDYLLELPDLPLPNWQIFDNYSPSNPYSQPTTHLSNDSPSIYTALTTQQQSNTESNTNTNSPNNNPTPTTALNIFNHN